MSIELKMLLFSAIFGLFQLLLAATGSVLQRGHKWSMGSRDVKAADLSGVPGRLHRAFFNFLETFALFAAAVLICAEMKVSNSTTVLGAQIYFYGRLIYLPVYAAGLPVVRTLVWFGATIGIFLVLSGAL